MNLYEITCDGEVTGWVRASNLRDAFNEIWWDFDDHDSFTLRNMKGNEVVCLSDDGGGDRIDQSVAEWCEDEETTCWVAE